MEPEFKQRNLTAGGPSYARLVIDALRKSREENPTADMVAGNLPFVGAMQAGMDVTDPKASNLAKGLALASIIPGGKLTGAIIKRLRGVERAAPKAASVVEHTFTPEDIFQKPDLKMSPAQREASRKAANDAYTKQLMEEEMNR